MMYVHWQECWCFACGQLLSGNWLKKCLLSTTAPVLLYILFEVLFGIIIMMLLNCVLVL